MAVSQYTGVAIGQTVVYVLVAPVAFYILVRNRSHRPIMAWYPFVWFSLMRLAGGPVTIVLQTNGGPSKQGNLGWVIAVTILLNVGIIPLLVTTLGLIRLIIADNPHMQASFVPKLIRLSTIAFIAACILIATGPSIGGTDLDNAALGRNLTTAGYVVFAVVLAGFIATELFLWRGVSKLILYTQKILMHDIVAIPFIVVRTVYGIKQVVTSTDMASPWNSVSGNTTLFALMCLLTELVVIWLYMWVGLIVSRQQETWKTENKPTSLTIRDILSPTPGINAEMRLQTFGFGDGEFFEQLRATC